ncbi:hypothetical protein PF005_g30969, partial [Phytophthora fragariae]
MGQFSVLADSDSEEDEVAFMDVDEGKQEFDAAAEEEDRDEAPYAYDGDSAADEMKEAVNLDVDDEEMTAVQNHPGRPKPLKSGRKKKQHSQTRGLQDGALKNVYRDMVAASPVSQENVDPSQDQECIICETKRGTADGDQDLPVQLGQWLHSFDGEEVS